jgi:hypothetical protein
MTDSARRNAKVARKNDRSLLVSSIVGVARRQTMNAQAGADSAELAEYW